MSETQAPRKLETIEPEITREAIKASILLSQEHYSKIVSSYAFGMMNNIMLFAIACMTSAFAFLTTEFGKAAFSAHKYWYMAAIAIAVFSIFLCFGAKLFVHKKATDKYNDYREILWKYFLYDKQISFPFGKKGAGGDYTNARWLAGLSLALSVLCIVILGTLAGIT